MKYILFLVLLVIVSIIVIKITNKLKFPKINCLAVFTGDVKVGKSGVSLACTVSNYKRIHFKWRIRSFFQKLFKKPIDEEPLLYSNIPIAGVKYCELKLEHIMRKHRFNFKSICFVDEASLLADCYLSKSHFDLSTKLLVFFKLFGHMTHGGYCVFNSQSISDLHISLRKCTSQYFYIHDTSSKLIPFFAFCHMREERYTEDGTATNVYNTDIEDTLKTCVFRKKIFKMYDYCAYSVLTDDLPTYNIYHYYKIGSNLKAKKLISFRQDFVDLFNNSLKETDYEKENN